MRRAQQPAGVQRVRGHHHAQARDVRERHLAALAVIDRAAVQIAADRHAQSPRRGETAVRTPAQRGQLVANLHHRRPDVIEELNLGHRLEPARRHADGAPHDGRFGERRVEAALASRTRSADRRSALKTPPLPFTSRRLASRLQSATSSPNTMTRVAPHLLAQGGVDQVRPWSAARRLSGWHRTAEVGSTVSE